ncbi:MAG: DNA polymerase I [Caldisericia bacterium]|nr:DNA polymerase I [Caldisericia bacterium]
MKKIYLIDGSSLLFRTYFALPPLINSKGEPTGATYGFVRIILNLIENENPQYIAVSFDKGAPTFRIDVLPQYKENRPKAPPDIKIQKERVKEILENLGIKTIEIEGYEGDDIIGTLKNNAEREGFYSVIITADKDLLQLLSENSEVRLTKKGITDIEIYTKDKFINEFGIKPERLPELKALIGDPSDNIPQIPSIGEKSGIKILKEYNSLFELINNPPANKFGEIIKIYKDQIIKSYEVAKIKTDLNLKISISNLKRSNENINNIIKIFSELEFHSLMDKFKVEIKKIESDYISKSDLFEEKEISFLKSDNEILFYCNKGFYKGRIEDLIELNNKKILFTHSFKNFISTFYPLNFKQNIFDTELASYILNTNKKNYDLKSLVPLYLGENIYDENPENLLPKILKIGQILLNEINECNLSKLLFDIELPISYILSEMEYYGVKIDKEKLLKIREEIKKKIEKLTIEISEISGSSINPQSPKQVSFLLYEKLGLKAFLKNKKNLSTDQETLIELLPIHPVIEKIIEFRELNKLLTTYFNILPELVDKNNRLHTTFIQTGTATGRIISKEPNLQNIPIRTEFGKKVREAFISDEDYFLASFDYSQIELRILAHFSSDENLIEAFNKGVDIHTETASQLFSIPKESITEEQRRKAKTINYGIIYGMSPHGLARELRISDEEAQIYIDLYFNKFRGVKKFIDSVISEAKEKGYVETILGRKRYIPELKSKNSNLIKLGERIAINTPIQGSGADIIKASMVNVWKNLKNRKSRIVLQIHDELLLEIHRDEVDEIIDMVKNEMENTIKLSVPIKVDYGIGKNWLECKK